jgi:hypothetical protein
MVMTADEAYAEAGRRIEVARVDGIHKLDLSDLEELKLLPPAIQKLDNLFSLNLGDAKW